MAGVGVPGRCPGRAGDDKRAVQKTWIYSGERGSKRNAAYGSLFDEAGIFRGERAQGVDGGGTGLGLDVFGIGKSDELEYNKEF